MLVIHADNVNDAYAEAMWHINMIGVKRKTRNGAVLASPGPVMTIYMNPTQRMLFDEQRDANPFFHIFESIWMLVGRDDVKWLKQFNSNIHKYSDDGEVFHGAYGARWRGLMGVDQLYFVIDELKRHPETRRAVVAMWDPALDDVAVSCDGKDVPCNTTIYFTIRHNTLEMTVCCRSNDIVWGCYGANAVHMSILQEFVANAIGLQVGKYYQFSNDWHIYEAHFPLMGKTPPEKLIYPEDHVSLTTPEGWMDDLDDFARWVNDPTTDSKNEFIFAVLDPMLKGWLLHKKGDTSLSLLALANIDDAAIREACSQWVTRRGAVT